MSYGCLGSHRGTSQGITGALGIMKAFLPGGPDVVLLVVLASRTSFFWEEVFSDGFGIRCVVIV